MHALVIDDARVVRMLLRGAMQQLGFEVSEASDGAEGLSQLRQGSTRPDVVLVDCHMPEMDGIEFIRQVRSDRSLDGVRLILVTGEKDAITNPDLADGADATLLKPFTKEALGRQLADLGVAVA